MRVQQIVFLATLSGCAHQLVSTQNGKVSTKTDAFTGETLRTLEGMTLSLNPGEGQAELRLVASDHKEGALASIQTMSKKGFRYRLCHDVDARADGQPLPLSQDSEHKETTESGFIKEVVEIFLTEEELTAMAKADSLQLRMCASIMTFTPPQLERLASFAGVGPVKTDPAIVRKTLQRARSLNTQQ